MKRLLDKIDNTFNKHSAKIEKALVIGTDAYGAFSGFFAMAVLETVTNTASSPASLPVALSAAAVGGIYMHRSGRP